MKRKPPPTKAEKQQLKKLTEDFYKAIEKSDITALTNLLKEDAELVYRMGDGNLYPPLEHAIRLQTTPPNLDTIKFLLLNGADIHQRSVYNHEPLAAAILINRLDVIPLLIEKGALINQSNFHANQYPLHWAVEKAGLEMLKVLIKFKVKTFVDEKGNTLLHTAVSFKKEEIIKYCIETLKIEIDSINKERQTPLHLAIKQRDEKITDFLLEKRANPTLTADEGQNIFHLALSTDRNKEPCPPEFLSKLLKKHPEGINKSAPKVGTPLMMAVKSGNLDLVKFLIEHKADVNQGDDTRQTPLHLAIKQRDEKIIDFLLSKGADTTLTTKGQNIFHLALSNDYNTKACTPELLSKLLEKYREGINTSAPKVGTPLIMAVKSGNLDLVKLLIEHGANVNKQDKEGRTALHEATAKPFYEPGLVELLIKYGANVNKQDNEGKTPLFKSLESFYKPDLVKLLIEHKADVNIQDNTGQTPLFKVIANNLYKAEEKKEIIVYLISQGANVRIADNNGDTLISIACEEKQEATIMTLVKLGAPIPDNTNSYNLKTVREVDKLLLNPYPQKLDLKERLPMPLLALIALRIKCIMESYDKEEEPKPKLTNAIKNLQEFHATNIHKYTFLSSPLLNFEKSELINSLKTLELLRASKTENPWQNFPPDVMQYFTDVFSKVSKHSPQTINTFYEAKKLATEKLAEAKKVEEAKALGEGGLNEGEGEGAYEEVADPMDVTGIT